MCCSVCRRQQRRPTILNAEGGISWPTLGEVAQDDSALAAKPKPVTFPQEMARFADKVCAADSVSSVAFAVACLPNDLPSASVSIMSAAESRVLCGVRMRCKCLACCCRWYASWWSMPASRR